MLSLLTAQIIQSATPQPHHSLFGHVDVEGVDADPGLEIVVGVGAPNNPQLLDLSPESVNVTDINGDYGKTSVFHLPADDLDTPIREGARTDEEISFFLITGDGLGHARTEPPQIIDPDRDVELVLAPRTQEFSEGIPFLVDIKVKPNGQPVTVVNAYLDFNPQFLQIDSIDTGDGTFEVVDLNSFDNVTGTADFSSRTNGPGVAEDFVLATITFIPTAPVGRTAIDFSTVFPRETTATFLGAAVVDSLSGLELLRLAQAETFLVEPGVLGPVVFEIGGDTEVDLSVSLVAVVRNLVRLTADNDNTPTFQWDLPAVPPQAGILTFEVATGDLGGPAFVDEDFRVFTGDAFEFTCFFEAVDVGCGDPNVIDTVQLTLISPLADGDYRLGVRIVDGDGIPGPVVQLPFTITLILIFPVTPPVLTPSGGGGVIIPPAPAGDPPIADAGADLEVSEGDTATLDASASFHPDGEEATALLTFLWEQLSGPPVELTAADTATPSFVTVDDAVYTFQVTVTDPELPDDPATDEVQVSVINVAPDVNAGPNQTQILGNAVTISPSFTDVGVEDTHSATVAWGDGTVDNIDPAVSPFSAEHAYEDNGTFTVTVTVTDDDGGAGADTVTVTIELPEPIPPTAVAGADQDADEGATLLFEGGGSLDPDGQILLYEWDFGDGLTAVGVTQTNVYDDDGVFTVTLTVTDDQGLSATDTMVVTVNNVAPRVEPGDTLRIDEGGTVTITPTFADLGVLDTHIALIDWGDDTEETLVDTATSPMSVEHVYSDNDTFTVTITVTDDDEGVTVETLDIIVANLDPEVEAGEDVIGFVGESVAIQPSFTDAGLDDTHSATVDWGDGTTGAVNLAISPLLLDHTYDATGQFIVTVTVTDDDGGTGTDTLQIVVISAVALTAGLEVSELTLSTESPSAGEPVSARFRVTNSSDVTLDATISVLVNGEEEIAIEITELRPGASRTLRTPRDQPIVRRDPGIYAIQVQDQVATFTILPAVIVVSNLTVSPRVAAPGNLIEILADVSNEGAAPGRFEVNISVDGDTFLREGRLLPDQVRTIRRAIPVTPNLVGITSPGLHNVRVEGEDDSYKIVRPVLSAPVPVNPPFNPATTAARDANGNSLGLVPGGAINFGRGSITFSLPLQVEQGVKVDSFVDVTSGINVIGTAVEVPVKDANGVTLLTVRGELAAPLEGSGDAASGVFESVRILTEERTEDLSAADPNVGNMSVTIDAGLDQLPPDTNVDVTIKKQLSEEDRFGVELLAREGSKIVANEAGTVTVETTALTNDDVADVDIAIKVSRDWIFQFGATNVRIAHVGSDGTLELLIPVCTPDETFTEFTCVAHSDKGFSEFSLLALANEPADFVAENLVVSPNAVAPGESVKITVDIINEGAAPGAFSSILKLALGEGLFEPIAVKEITLLAGETGRVTFFVEREEQGEYSIEVEGRRGEFLRSTFEVSRALDPANLSLSDLIITPALVEPFNSVTIKLVATNQGEVDGRTELEFRINSVLTELRSLVIPGGSSIDVEFNFEPPAEGVFTVEITDPEERVQPVSGEIIAEIPLSPAILVFEEFGVTPLQAQPGEQVTVSFAITNFGETPDTFTAILLLNDEEIARQVDVSVDALASEPIVFTFDAPAETGQYTVVVEDTGLDGSFSVVGIANVLRIVSLDVSATQVLFGDDVTVSVVLENTTGQPLTQTLSLILDGTIFEDRTVTVAAGETTTETFDIVSPAEGSHSVEIAGVPAKSFDVRVTEVQPALLKLSPSIEISPREVEAGDTVTIRVTITNEGEEPGATTLILQVNGVEADRKSSGTIRGGQNVTVEFETAQEEGGDYNVLVQALEAEEGFDIGEDSFTVLAVPTDNLVLVRPVTVAPSSVVSGLPVTISVLVTNEGTVEGTLPVRLLIDGTLIDTQDVTLAGGGSITVEFADIVEPGVGVHQVSVNGLTSQFTVTAEAAAAAGGSPIIIIVIVVVVVLIAAGGGAFFFMKKKAA